MNGVKFENRQFSLSWVVYKDKNDMKAKSANKS